MPFVVCSCRPVLHRSRVAGRAPECGTLTIKFIGFDACQYSFCTFGCGGVEPRVLGWVGLSTLLGPEGSLTLVGGFQCGPMPAPSGCLGLVSARVLRTSQWTRASL